MRPILASFAALLLATAALAPPATSAATVVRLAPGTATHLLQAPRSLVTLVGRPVNIGALSYGYDFQRILSNGSITGTCSDADSSGCFRVPAGNVLIITDISWAQDTDLTEGLLRIFELRAGSVETNILYATTGLTDSWGMWRGSEHLTGGIVIDSSVTNLRASLQESLPGNSSVFLRGYLAPDK